jgi:hypothetical protein
MPRLTHVPCAETRRRGTTLRLSLQQVTGLVQDGKPEIGRRRPRTEATEWMQARHAAGRLREGTRA